MLVYTAVVLLISLNMKSLIKKKKNIKIDIKKPPMTIQNRIFSNFHTGVLYEG